MDGDLVGAGSGHDAAVLQSVLDSAEAIANGVLKEQEVQLPLASIIAYNNPDVNV